MCKGQFSYDRLDKHLLLVHKVKNTPKYIEKRNDTKMNRIVAEYVEFLKSLNGGLCSDDQAKQKAYIKSVVSLSQ